jgi:hypothetical protein
MLATSFVLICYHVSILQVSRLYRDKSLELDVRFTLTKVIIIEAFEVSHIDIEI